MFDFAITGLGATGVSFLRQLHSQLYEQELKPITVAVISPAESFAVGLAFGKAESFLKVNTPHELMSIDPEDPHGFFCMDETPAGGRRAVSFPFEILQVFKGYLSKRTEN
ncbi:MAG: FAD/NAD(P)-binding protein [Marinobacter sp.]|uniref:FAD/NAD(P)-binding protein n=1 Tax=Marinobacter sp. AC-23 TaxID=1879031 RepID=UPI0008DCC66D|nr:FAD/NAD(P)-binding protein [Marinobacter sp. AC-23]OHY72799.1 hypothetical protein BCA33_19210 [Marinobacter sp. AC-23]